MKTHIHLYPTNNYTKIQIQPLLLRNNTNQDNLHTLDVTRSVSGITGER